MASHKRETVYAMTNGKCFYCGCDLDFDNFHMDHYSSKRSGGKVKDNLVPSCPDCNLCKGALPVEEFREKVRKLITDTHHGRVIAKYYGLTSKPIRFFFEEAEDGDI